MALAEAAVEVAVDVDKLERQARTEVSQAARDAGRAFDDGFKQGTKDTGSDVTAQVNRRIRDSRGRFVKQGEDSGEAFGDGFKRGADGRLRDSRGRFVQEAPKDFHKSGDESGKEFSDGFSRALNFQLASKALSGAFAPLRGIGQLLGLSLIATQAAAAAASMLQFAAALAPAAGILVSFPGAIALGAAALGTMKVALSGVGDIFSSAISDDTQKFEKAIANLAPALQSVAREVRTLAPDLLALRNEVQQAFFAQLEGQLTAVASVLLGPMQAGMSGVADAFGRGAVEVANFLQQSATVGAVAQVFDTTRQAVEAFLPALQPLLAGFRDIAVVGLSLFPSLAGSIAHASAEFGTFLSEAAASGKALSWLNGALVLFRSLGDIVDQVSQLLTSVFKAASDSGGDLVGSLDKVLQVFNEFAQSVEGQQALVAIFQALGTAGKQLGQVIVSVAEGLGSLAPIVAQIAIALGPALRTAIDGIAAGLAGLGPSLIPVAKGLADAFSALAPALGPLGEALGNLIKALTPILPLLGQVAFIMATTLTQAINGLIPVITPFIKIFVDHLSKNLPELLPILTDLTDAFTQLAIALVPIAVPAAQLLTILIRFLIVASVVPGLHNLADAIRFVADAINFATGFWKGFFSILAQVPGFVSNVINTLRSSVSAIPGFFSELPGKILQALQALPGMLTNFFSTVFSTLLPALETGALQIIEFFFALPGRIIGAVFGLIAMWLDFVTTFWTVVIGAIVLGGDAVIAFFISLPGRIMAGVSALPGLLFGFFTNLWNTVVGLVRSGVSQVVSFIGSIPGQIANLAGLMQNAGHALIRGLFAGLEAVGSFAGSFATKVVAAIKSGINKGIDAINSGINKINGKLPGSPIPNIPRFARGGIIDQATLGIIGEAGPELIMPLKPSMRKRALGLAKKSGAYQMIINDHEKHRAQMAQPQHTEVHNHFTIHSQAGDPEIMAQKIIGRIAQRVAL